MNYKSFPSLVVEDNIFKTTLARQNWQSKYQYGDENPLETFKRVAQALASVENDPEYWYGRFLDMMVKTEPTEDGNFRAVGLKNTFGGRITANAGTEYNGATLMNCYINLPPRDAKVSYTHKFDDGSSHEVEYSTGESPDSLSNIMLALLEQANTLKSEGGYGINFGWIRPRGSIIKGVGIKHPGVVHYMDIWDKVASVIVMGDNDGYRDTLENYFNGNEDVGMRLKKQARKGAQMAVLSVWHPDVEEFIRAKQEPGRLTKFNISVLVDDKFMRAVENNDYYDLWFPERYRGDVSGKTVENLRYANEHDSEDNLLYADAHGLYYTKKVYKRVKARELYDLMMSSTYRRSEPGILFYNNMQSNNPLSYINTISATNPCGEVGGFLTVCLLGNSNLTQYVKEDRSFDWELYEKDLAVFSRALDNVNDLTKNSLPQYDWATKNVRQYGMGLNGLGSALMMMGIPFNSEEALSFTEKVASLKEDITWRTSAELAKEKGPFPGYNKKFLETKWFTEFTKISEETKDLIRKYGARNGKTTTNAPNGNTSVICDMTSNGIEPVFMVEYQRTYIADDWPEGLTKNNIKDILTEREFGDSTAWQGEYNGKTYMYEPHNRGLCIVEPVRDYGYQWIMDNYPEDLQADYIVTTNELSVTDHVNSQEVVQRNLNQSVSKTVNLPAEYDFEKFKNLYLEAWKRGLNGLTTYVSGSMEAVLSQVEESKASEQPEVIKSDLKLPDEFVNGHMHIVKKEGQKFYMHFSYLPEDDNQVFPIALWIHTNNTGEIREANGVVKVLVQLLENFGIDESLIERQKEKIVGNPGYMRVGKMLSMALRHNIPIPNIVAALDRVPDIYVTDLVFAIKKFLALQIENGTEVNDVTCQECGSDEIIFESGCTLCKSCGASECA